MLIHGVQLPGNSDEAAARTRASCDKAIAAHQNFNLKVMKRRTTAVTARLGSARGSISGPSTSTLQLQFRSANSSTVDSSTPHIAVPATMGSMAPVEGGPTYYYATITKAAAAAVSSTPPSSAAVAGRRGSDSRTSASASGNVLLSGSAIDSCGSLGVFTLVDDGAAAFEDVTLGPMLGYGSYGRVYRGEAGWWRGWWLKYAPVMEGEGSTAAFNGVGITD